MPEGGEEATILAVHGSPGSVRDWRYLAGALAERAPTLRLLRVDLPGYASSSDEALHAALSGREDWAPLLRAIAAQVGVQTPLVVLGHSSGAHVALSFAAGAGAGEGLPGAAGLALVNPIGLSPHKGISPFWLVQALGWPLTWTWAKQAWAAGVLHPLYTSVLGFSPRTSVADVSLSHRRTMHLDFPAANAAAATVADEGVPTLVAWTADDNLVQESISTRLARALPHGPRLAFPSGGHHAQKYHAHDIADALAALVRDYILASDSDEADG